MNFLFSLLRIKSLYMLRALPAHPQEALHKRRFGILRVMSVGCTKIGAANGDTTQYTKTPFLERLLRMSG
jgi:hypothetical protein